MRTDQQEKLLGLQAWRIQRRNRRIRGLVRGAMLGFVVAAYTSLAPPLLNPIGLLIGSVTADDIDRARDPVTWGQKRLAVVQAAVAVREGGTGRPPGPAFRNEPPAALPSAPFAAAEMGCLARAVFFEGRSEGIEGMIAVAQVVLNRFNAGTAASLCKVVAQGSERGLKNCVFPAACDRSANPPESHQMWLQSRWIAEEVAAGRAHLRELTHALRFHPHHEFPFWRFNMVQARRIGRLVFLMPDGRKADMSLAREVVRRWDEPPTFEMIRAVDERPGMLVTTSSSSPLDVKPRATTVKTQAPRTSGEAFNPFKDGASER